MSGFCCHGNLTAIVSVWNRGRIPLFNLLCHREARFTGFQVWSGGLIGGISDGNLPQRAGSWRFSIELFSSPRQSGGLVFNKRGLGRYQSHGAPSATAAFAKP
jgi:hypothetical protein